MRKIWILLLVFLPFIGISQQIKSEQTRTIEQIMQGEKFVGYLPDGISWSEDSREIYFRWNPEGELISSFYSINPKTSTRKKLSLEERKTLRGEGDYTRDFKLKVFERSGDIFLYDLRSDEEQAVMQTVSSERNPAFRGDDQAIAFRRGNNLFGWELETGHLTQLTNFKDGKERTERPNPEFREWLERDQLEYIQILQERKEKSDAEQALRDSLRPEYPHEIFLNDNRLRNLTISPDWRFVIYQINIDANADRTGVPNFVTQSGFTEDLPARAKVGSPEDTYESYVFDRQRDTVYRISVEGLAGIYDKPAYLEEYHTDEEAFDDTYNSPREVIIHGPVFSENGKALVVVRSMDNKDRWIALLDLESGELKTLDRQHDDAWIGGPGISGWNYVMGNCGWLKDDQTIWFQSEETGYSHLYTLNVETGQKKALTKGEYEIIDVELSRDGERFYITSNNESPHEHHFYRLPASGGAMELITSKAGNHQVFISPNEEWLAIRYSYSNRPWELYIMANEPGAEMRQLTQSTTDAFESYDWRDPEIVYFGARDGVEVPARIYRPDTPIVNGPAVIFVHGAGYLQNVHKWWSNYYREFMFHNFLADHGYTVLDIDYRASEGYGRDWRTAVYRHMGGKDLEDQVDGAKFLVEQYDIDPDRIGIYGGSYGGFITLMAMFTSPGTFKCGAALRSVTDWAHYNHPYTANILNTPVQDSIAYRRSSPIYHAEGLEDRLLILHGMIDRNVQFQDVVRLSQRLIELGKEDWELAVFPLEGHGFVEPTSWTDEYRRIFKLFEEELK